jgi:hypothetical protein
MTNQPVTLGSIVRELPPETGEVETLVAVNDSKNVDERVHTDESK